jgi:hypothetical protein
MEQFVITSNVAVRNRRKKALNLTHDLKNQSTQWLLCFSNDRANSMIHENGVLVRLVVPVTCYISYARIVAIFMPYKKRSHFALDCVTKQGTPVCGTLE